MKKYLMVLVLISITACWHTSDGVREGRLVQASVTGAFVDSCEYTLLLSEQGSVTWNASARVDQCPALIENIGKNVRIKYQEEMFRLFYDTGYSLDSITFKN